MTIGILSNPRFPLEYFPEGNRGGVYPMNKSGGEGRGRSELLLTCRQFYSSSSPCPSHKLPSFGHLHYPSIRHTTGWIILILLFWTIFHISILNHNFFIGISHNTALTSTIYIDIPCSFFFFQIFLFQISCASVAKHPLALF